MYKQFRQTGLTATLKLKSLKTTYTLFVLLSTCDIRGGARRAGQADAGIWPRVSDGTLRWDLMTSPYTLLLPNGASQVHSHCIGAPARSCIWKKSGFL